MKTEEIKQASLELIESAPAAYLTTIGPDGFPHTRAMLNLRNKEMYPNQVPLFAPHQDDMMIYFSTNTSSSKIGQIKANTRVCVYYCNPEQFHGLMLSGNIEIVDDAQIRQALWNEGWERYYPGGPHDPDHTVLRLYPAFAKGWYKAQGFEFDLGGA
ncbi:MAG: pyridoxamine 5'-phosphate oxidase family protein [Anaerolineae bacterium]|jgi:general stress protein 26